jgi:hypothetical protein
MTKSLNSTPAFFDHPELGQIRSVISFPPHVREFLQNMIAEGDIRCIWHEGHQFVPLREVEPYSLTDLDGEELEQVFLPAAGEALLGAVEAQASSDEAIQRKRAKLVEFVRAPRNPAPNPFAQVLWKFFWRDAADVGANLASEAEAQKMADALTVLNESAADGTVNSVGLPHFHRVLLSVAAPELDAKFDEIWSPGRGRLEIDDLQKLTTVLVTLRRLIMTFTGYRGDPEGSQTPVYEMNQYLQLVSLKAGA